MTRNSLKRGCSTGKYSEALQRVFEIHPACACEEPREVTKKDVEELIPKAEDFLVVVEEYLGVRK